MKSKFRLIHVLFFILLLVLPIQVFGHGEDDDGHDVDNAPWLSEKVKSDGGTDDQGHGDDDHSHGETEDHGHGDEDDHGHGKTDGHGHGDEDDHGHGKTEDHGHGDEDAHGHGETEDHGHGKTDDHSHGETDDHGHGESDDHGHGDDDHDHEYKETGANLPLLGTFAAINGGFILFGAIRKINKKRKSGVK
jgi:hypothetical protein